MDQTTIADVDLAESLRAGEPDHPALARLTRRLNEGGGAAEEITSYDRMHHRHNRA